jgi:hypothetical protein
MYGLKPVSSAKPAAFSICRVPARRIKPSPFQADALLARVYFDASPLARERTAAELVRDKE